MEKEIGLRDETRTLQQAREALTDKEFHKRGEPLAAVQMDLRERVVHVIQAIRQEPNGEQDFAQEIALLSRVKVVMQEAYALLSIPETGPETIAAETEIIELLMQARRANPKGGGGGGGASPGGGGTGTTDQSALALIGSGSEKHAQRRARTVTQTTGVSGGQLPAEYRIGLDAYFSALEENRSGMSPD